MNVARLLTLWILTLAIMVGFAAFLAREPLMAGTGRELGAANGEGRAIDLSHQTIVDIVIDESVASGFVQPVHVTHAADDSGRLFVVEQPGRINIVLDGATALFLDVADRVLSGGERGLLSVAFPPGFDAKGHFYVNYTRIPDGATVVARYRISTDPDVADPNSEEIVLIVPQPVGNHNGGQLAFGPVDGYLYIGMGDGGSGGDPDNHAQNPQSMLGKMLRIDVETGNPLTYTIPASNPFTQTLGFLDEIWALGLRNPWRFSFDRANGDLYIGDVGQNEMEEVDYLAFTTGGGANLGWRCREGTHTFRTNPPCDDPTLLASLTDPIAQYSHLEGRTVTGGFVYRGYDYPALVGRYFYGDYAVGKIWSIDTNACCTPLLELDTELKLSAFGEGEDGELYVADYGGGTIRRLAASNGPSPDLSHSQKSASSVRVFPGEPLTFTVQLVNTGPASASTARLTDTLPTGLVYQPDSMSATHGVVDDSTSPVLRWQGTLTPHKTITITYLVTPTGAPGFFVNRAEITGEGLSPVELSSEVSVLHSVFMPVVIK